MGPFYVEKSIGFEIDFQNLYSSTSVVQSLFFLERWQRSGIRYVKRPFYHRTKKDILDIGNGISEMKQTKM